MSNIEYVIRLINESWAGEGKPFDELAKTLREDAHLSEFVEVLERPFAAADDGANHDDLTDSFAVLEDEMSTRDAQSALQAPHSAKGWSTAQFLASFADEALAGTSL